MADIAFVRKVLDMERANDIFWTADNEMAIDKLRNHLAQLEAEEVV